MQDQQIPTLHTLPVPSTDIRPVPKVEKMGPPPHFLAAFFFSFFLGVFGVDRFYLKRYGSGVLKLLTFGGFGISAIVDLALIMNNALRDRYERPLVGYEEYKKLAKKTIIWTTAVVAAFILINGVVLVISVVALFNSFTSGQFKSSLPPGIDQSSLDGLGL